MWGLFITNLAICETENPLHSHPGNENRTESTCGRIGSDSNGDKMLASISCRKTNRDAHTSCQAAILAVRNPEVGPAKPASDGSTMRSANLEKTS